MFALSDAGETWMGRPIIERRAICFVSQKEAASITHDSSCFEDVMELRVYRSKGRKRIQPELEDLRVPSNGSLEKISQQDLGDLQRMFSGSDKKTSKQEGKGGIKSVTCPGSGPQLH